MTPESLIITFPMLTNGLDSSILTNFQAIYEFSKETNKRTDKQIGISYEIVLDSNNYEKLVVKTSDLKPAISLEELEKAKTPIRCSFEGFKARFYRNYRTNTYALTASADKIILLEDGISIY